VGFAEGYSLGENLLGGFLQLMNATLLSQEEALERHNVGCGS